VRLISQAERPIWNAEVSGASGPQKAMLVGPRPCHQAEYHANGLALLGRTAPIWHRVCATGGFGGRKPNGQFAARSGSARATPLSEKSRC